MSGISGATEGKKVMKEILNAALHAMDNGESTVLVSIVGKSGSAPRGVGAHMLIGCNGRIAGTIGGGVTEAEAIRAGCEALREQVSCMRNYHLREDGEESTGSVCGGDVTLRLQYVPCGDTRLHDAIATAKTRLETKEACWIIIGPLDDSLGAISVYNDLGVKGAEVPPEVTGTLGSCSKCVTVRGKSYYTQPLIPKGRVYIFGGGHIAQALVPVLSGVDFRCVILEDRTEFCRPELFPGVEEVRLIRPEEWEKHLRITPYDYICVMTRGHKNDIDCQAFALRTEARYIGVMGSRRKIAIVNSELKRRGFTESELARIVTPIGLPILAETPGEIAISIAAQLIQVRAQGMPKGQMEL